jgi:23S rRNA pseudouridine1911/1915/1917 synthase
MRFEAAESDAGKRLDCWVAEAAGLSRAAVQKAIEAGRVELNGAPANKKYQLKPGDLVELYEEEPEEYEAVAEDIPLDVVYEDEWLIVINKPSGMVVHPAPGNECGTLVNALLYHCKDSLSGIGGVMRPGIVHRIDKDTSGLIVCAKCDAAHQGLTEQLASHGVVREYHALVNGGFSSDTGTVDMPIGRHPVDRKRMAVLTSPSAHAKRAVTHYEVLRRYGAITYLKLVLETGRTHQIRVHMSHTGHPLLGDTVYGGGKSRFEREHARLLSGQVLHAKKLSFIHPITNERVNFECPLPREMTELIRILDEEN